MNCFSLNVYRTDHQEHNWLTFIEQFNGCFYGESQRCGYRNQQGSITKWNQVVLSVKVMNVQQQEATIEGIGVCVCSNRQYICLLDGKIQQYDVHITKQNYLHHEFVNQIEWTFSIESTEHERQKIRMKYEPKGRKIEHLRGWLKAVDV